MKIVFMGTPDFAAAPLKALAESQDVVAVISQPDRPKGRGKKLQPTPVKEAAQFYNIPVYQPEKIKDSVFIQQLKEFNADLFVVVAYGQILSKEILALPKLGCVNIHGSLLPKYRGPAPIQWARINGDKVTGVTIMMMDEGMDTGDIILTREFPIDPHETSGSLHEKLSLLGSEALMETLPFFEGGNVPRRKQDQEKATYAPMLKKEDGHINWEMGAEEILNLIRGLNPWPSAYSFLAGQDMLKIWDGKIIQGDFPGAPGEVVQVDNRTGIVVKTGLDALLLTEVQGKGGKRMACADYLRGNPIGQHDFLK